MYCLALCELGAPLEQEEEPIAAILGLAPYDVRIRLGGTLPRIAVQAADVASVVAFAERLRKRGHGAIVFDTSDATSLDRMTLMRRFGVEGGTLFANDRKAPGHSLQDLVALVHASMNVSVLRTTREMVQVRSGRGTVREERKHTAAEQHLEKLVVLFWREGPPWLLRQSAAHYLALGDQLRPTNHENFALAIEWLRARAPNARYDDRFVDHPLTPHRTVGARDAESPSALGTDRGVELTIHALGTWLSREEGGPYR